MNKKDEALKLALEALESDPLDMVLNPDGHMGFRKDNAITAIREALAEQQQEPTCKQNLQVWVISNGKGKGQFSWEPQDERYWTRMEPSKPWVGLTSQEVYACADESGLPQELSTGDLQAFGQAIEAKLKEKNA